MRIVFTLGTLLTFSTLLTAADPIVGTWKLNLAKSKLHNPVQSYLMTIELTPPNTYRCVFDVVNEGRESASRDHSH
jgi:hypothetical protein